MTMALSIIERYTEGDCWVLMKRLHRVSGWPCAAFYCRDGDGEIEASVHGFVQCPNGKYLDVEGVWTAAEMTEKYSEYSDEFEGICCFPKSYFRWVTPEFGRYSYKLAVKVADDLLDKYADCV